MKHYRLWLLGCAVFGSLALVTPAQAQLRDRASVSYEVLPEKSDVSAQQTEVNVSHRFMFDTEGEKLLTATLSYRETVFDFEGSDNPGFEGSNRRVQMIVPQFTYLHILNEEYSLIVQARPGFFGDFQGGFGKSFRLEGSFLFSKPYSDRLTLGFGLANGSNFGRVLTVPIVQVLYFPTEKIMIDALLPVRADALYLFSKDFEAGASFNITGSNYRIEANDNLGAEQLEFANITLGGIARRQVLTNLYLSGELGTTVMRRFNFVDGPNEIDELEPDNTFYARVGLQYRF
ncbi:MAG: DUF6268 family outer membrane beta-barrel protein [Bdellovibrionales bacterium]